MATYLVFVLMDTLIKCSSVFSIPTGDVVLNSFMGLFTHMLILFSNCAGVFSAFKLHVFSHTFLREIVLLCLKAGNVKSDYVKIMI